MAGLTRWIRRGEVLHYSPRDETPLTGGILYNSISVDLAADYRRPSRVAKHYKSFLPHRFGFKLLPLRMLP